jgi:hypothetical protein
VIPERRSSCKLSFGRHIPKDPEYSRLWKTGGPNRQIGGSLTLPWHAGFQGYPYGLRPFLQSWRLKSNRPAAPSYGEWCGCGKMAG